MEHELPSFSVIIPTYRRAKQLAGCLEALTQLDYPADCFEVVVVDDGSGSPPEAVVAPFRGRLDVKLVTQTHAGPATARNTGAARSGARHLAFTDDDCAPAPGWLRAFAARLARDADGAVGGRTENALVQSLYPSASQLLVAYIYRYYNAQANRARFFASNNLAVPADRFRAIGGFDTTAPLPAGEDREFCYRWLCHGYAMSYAPEAVVHHSHPLTLRGFARQHFTYGRGAFYFHRARARRSQLPIRPEPLPFYINLLRQPFVHASGHPALALAGLLALSQIANAAGFFYEAHREVRSQIDARRRRS